MQFTEFTFMAQGDLRITLTEAGKQELQRLLKDHADWSDDEILLELIDEHLLLEWKIVPPEQIRAMRDMLILSDSVRYDHEGNVAHLDSAYWHPSNQLGIVSGILMENGYVIFEKGHRHQ
ncbi:MAG: hypothetical protein KF726_19730 [Anaerolineae bacterium]|nr:hypothetical protein [Anaerolineae bacterium]